MTDFQISSDLIALAHQLADAAGAVVRRYFRTSFQVDGKADLSPVTVADREAERVMRAIIAANRPEDGIWGEEFGAERGDAPFLWVLDPVDGTRAFMTGKPVFGTLIGLLHQGVPVLGVIDQPVLRERWIGGAGYPTLFNGAPCRTRACAALDQAVVTVGHLPFPKVRETDMRVYRALVTAAATEAVGGDCYAYAMLASGHGDVVIENELKLHDFAALAPVVAGAGGAMTDWRGQPLRMDSAGDVLAVGDERVLQAALEVIRSGKGDGL